MLFICISPVMSRSKQDLFVVMSLKLNQDDSHCGSSRVHMRTYLNEIKEKPKAELRLPLLRNESSC